MIDLQVVIQKFLFDSRPDWIASARAFRMQQGGMDENQKALSRCIYRLMHALSTWNQTPTSIGAAELAILFRQVIQTHGTLRIPIDLFRLMQPFFQLSSLVSTQPNTQEFGVLDSVDWCADWLAHSEKAGHLIARRKFDSVPADGMLLGMAGDNGIQSYRFRGQRDAVYASMFLPEGDTLFVVLPTGSGKSICTLLPAWVNSKGGHTTGGTTLVIVPTVALAMDQYRSAKPFYEGSADLGSIAALNGASPAPERDAVRHGLRNGTLSLAFMSPELLLRSELYDIALEAAEAGTLKCIVIDEAHLVEAWGASFRAEFQLLAAFIQRLQSVSGGLIRIILMTATATEATRTVLKSIFAPNGRWHEMIANQLRPEIQFYTNVASNESIRRTRVLEVLRHLPRPAIVYVTYPDQAAEWVQFLRNDAGFHRIAAFTGQTKSDERERLLDAWRNDDLDIMVATAAFGVGVDKPDIRTIIHACVPESLDRFYQEVGRGGRDGYSTVSVLCVTNYDFERARGLTSKSHITAERAWIRWRSMRETAQPNAARWIVDVRTVPYDKPEQDESERGTDWNWHVLLLMQRVGSIRLSDLRIEGATLDHIEIEILDYEAANYEKTFIARLGYVRDEERARVAIDSTSVEHLVKQSQHCIATEFRALYRPVALACGGCPSCREVERNPYAHPPVQTESPWPDWVITSRMKRALRDRFGSENLVFAFYDAAPINETLVAAARLATQFVPAGIGQLIFSGDLTDDLQLLHELKQVAYFPHAVRDLRDVEAGSLLPTDTAVVLPHEVKEAELLYRSVLNWHRNLEQRKSLLIFAHRETHLSPAYGVLRAHAPGIHISTDIAREWVKLQRTVLD